ncbi:MAG: hypothetical protein PVJ09_03005 [Candidatus Woesebacteria bacterium]|jgi:hypothetical protein
MTYFEELLKILEEEKVEAGEIAVIVAELMKASTFKLYTQLLSVMSPEEKEQLQKAKSEEAANQLLNTLYPKYHQKTVEEAIIELQDSFAQKFLKNYKSAGASK